MKEATNYDLLDGGRKLPLVEDFYTIQGEGFHTGKPAYFIRLGGCDVGCRWCDAKYTWNPKLYPPTDISEVVRRATSCQAQAIVITGGEPLLYPLGPLTSALKGHGLKIFLETSGSHPFSGYLLLSSSISSLPFAPFQRVFRLGLPFAQASAAASAGGVLAGARAEGHRRAGGRFAMGRAERRTGRTGVQALPAARMERVGGDHAPAGRVRQGASCVEYFDPDA